MILQNYCKIKTTIQSSIYTVLEQKQVLHESLFSKLNLAKGGGSETYLYIHM